eukprot:6460832-Prymnesium_polylepis.1
MDPNQPSLGDESQPTIPLGDVPNQTGAPMRRPKHTMRRPDREEDARDDLDAHAVLAVELVEE